MPDPPTSLSALRLSLWDRHGNCHEYVDGQHVRYVQNNDVGPVVGSLEAFRLDPKATEVVCVDCGFRQTLDHPVTKGACEHRYCLSVWTKPSDLAMLEYISDKSGLQTSLVPLRKQRAIALPELYWQTYPPALYEELYGLSNVSEVVLTKDPIVSQFYLRTGWTFPPGHEDRYDGEPWALLSTDHLMVAELQMHTVDPSDTTGLVCLNCGTKMTVANLAANLACPGRRSPCGPITFPKCPCVPACEAGRTHVKVAHESEARLLGYDFAERWRQAGAALPKKAADMWHAISRSGEFAYPPRPIPWSRSNDGILKDAREREHRRLSQERGAFASSSTRLPGQPSTSLSSPAGQAPGPVCIPKKSAPYPYPLKK